jgi:hypothetical protein
MLLPERAFNIALPLVVRKTFTSAGRQLMPGDDFDWRRHFVTPRRVRQLFDAGYLDHPSETVSAAVAADTPEPEPEPEAEGTAVPADAASALPQDDGLDDLDMVRLREIADAEGAPYRVSRAAQREAIRENRRARAAG